MSDFSLAGRASDGPISKTFRLPAGVHARLQHLLDKQDAGEALTDDERNEAEGLVDIAEYLTLLRLRAGF